MGLLGTRWEAEYEGHNLAVSRNEFTRGFKLDWDGTRIARRSWSWVGIGQLHASAELNGKSIDVKVSIHWGGDSGKCSIEVDGASLDVTQVK